MGKEGGSNYGEIFSSRVAVLARPCREGQYISRELILILPNSRKCSNRFIT